MSNLAHFVQCWFWFWCHKKERDFFFVFSLLSFGEMKPLLGRLLWISQQTGVVEFENFSHLISFFLFVFVLPVSSGHNEKPQTSHCKCNERLDICFEFVLTRRNIGHSPSFQKKHSEMAFYDDKHSKRWEHIHFRTQFFCENTHRRHQVYTAVS